MEAKFTHTALCWLDGCYVNYDWKHFTSLEAALEFANANINKYFDIEVVKYYENAEKYAL